MSSNDRMPVRMGHTEPSHAGPRHAGFWIHAERRGRRVLLAPLWVVLAGLFPTLVLWLIVLPRLISGGLLD